MLQTSPRPLFFFHLQNGKWWHRWKRTANVRSKFNPRHTINVKFPSFLHQRTVYEHKGTLHQAPTPIEGPVFYEGSSRWPFVVTVDCTHLETMTTTVLWAQLVPNAALHKAASILQLFPTQHSLAWMWARSSVKRNEQCLGGVQLQLTISHPFLTH